MIKLRRLKDKHNKVIYIISTTKGLMLDSECIVAGIGGEVLVKVVI
jgi:ribosomal protein S8